MKQINGNLLEMFDEGDFDIIVHGCNCHNNMGGGIAAQIAGRYPTVETADNKTEAGDINKLGQIIPVWLAPRWLKWVSWFLPPKIVVNAYTQYNPGRDGNIQAIEHAFLNLEKLIYNKGWEDLKIGIPAIGCGIAGLEWEQVERVIDTICGDLDITLVVYEP